MNSDFNRHLGAKLRMRRLSLGLTQTKVAKAITPVPGGVGPMTIACLLNNTVECFKKIQTNTNAELKKY